MNNFPFKIISHLKINWLKNASGDCGAMKMVIDSAPDSNIIINSVSVKFGRMWADATPETLIKILTKDNGIYEVITKYPHKVYFDIDMKGKPDNMFLDKCITSINELFSDSDMAISGSVFEAKTSYHICLNNYHITSDNDRQIIKGVVRYLNEHVSDAFDTKVYTNNRNMKCINQSKGDKRIQSIISNNDTKKHLITCCFNDTIYNMPAFDIPIISISDKTETRDKNIKLAIAIEKSSEKFDIGKLPVLTLKIHPDFNIRETSALELLNLLPLNIQFDHSYTHYIARFCYFNNLSFDNFFSWYTTGKNDTLENKTKWISHWENLKLFPVVKIENIIFLLCKYYPNFKQNKKMRMLTDNFSFFDNNTATIKKVDTLTQNVFNDVNKFVILNTGMGSGKTAQTIDYLKNVNKFCWMTPNIALAQNTHHRMVQNKIDCCYYKDTKLFKNSSDKLKLNNYDNLIICINSLHYLTKKNYKVVVIDEIETLLLKWHNNTTFNSKVETKIDCWLNFIDIIKNADKVILLDAFTSKLTTNFIDNITHGTANYHIYELNDTKSKRDIYILDKYQNFFNSIINDLKAGKKLFVFYPYKGKNRNLPSMAEFKKLLCEKTGKKIMFYNADVDDVVLETLHDVNDSWIDYDCIITNTKITVGINFDKLYFDKVYAGIAGFNISRDVIQATYRCRHLTENSITICFFDKSNTNYCFLNDGHQVADCPIYKKMVLDVLIEKHAPLVGSLYHFCKKANYKICLSDNTISDETTKCINKMLKSTENICFSYSQLPDYDYESIKDVEQKLYSNTATLEDKMSINKYYFNLKFIPSADKELVCVAWDTSFNFFFDKLIELSSREDNIFDKIKKYNDFSSIFPLEKELAKVKLNDELLTQIFNEYHFSRLTKTSSVNVIIKNIYATFFNKTIILLRDDNRHEKMVVHANIIAMYEFALANLKNFQTNQDEKKAYDIFDDDDDDDEIVNNYLDKNITTYDDIDVIDVINVPVCKEVKNRFIISFFDDE